MGIGTRIRACREAVGLTQQALADLLGYSSRSSIAKIESEVNDIPHNKIGAFADALHTTAAHLMGWSDPTAPRENALPLLGTIACGGPIYAAENIEEYLPAPDGITADFCLRCRGNSMIDARICDGDIVYIRTQNRVENGQIAAVLIGEEATLKRVYCTDGSITLAAANEAFPPMVFVGQEAERIRILGLAVAFWSRIG
ncbi:MAG: helix-turn-helix domain-containing protein [Clostridia bacterium]|nr:helix-turn-helix domain-containing protein [Clostridia bacterium]